jgi:DNA repair protein RadC
MKTEIVQDGSIAADCPTREVECFKSSPSPKLNELRVSYRRRPGSKRFAPNERTILDRPEKCYEYLRRVWDTDTLELREEFLLICLDQSLAVNGWVRLHAGGFDTCGLDLRLLFGVAVKTASSAIVIAHNHPTGNLTPSPTDRNITRQIAAAAQLLGIRFVDHLIVTGNGFYSFNERDPSLFENGHATGFSFRT